MDTATQRNFRIGENTMKNKNSFIVPYTKFRAFIMSNHKHGGGRHMSRDICSVFETSEAQSDYVAGRLLYNSFNQPKLKAALLTWWPSIYSEKSWLDSFSKYSETKRLKL